MVIDGGARVALERLYEVFSRYPLPGSEVCTHCVAPEVVEAIRAVPLRQLSAAAMERYAFNESTWGGIEDFKYYLPRLLELLIGEELDGICAPGLTRCLGAYWVGWPEDEREAVVAVIGGWWRETLQRFPRDVDVVMMLEIIGTDLGLNLSDYLSA